MRAAAGLRTLLAVASLGFLLLLVTSGFPVMTGYVPSEREAFDSVLYLRRGPGLGGFLRSVHVHAASALVASGALYLLAAFALGAPSREPRAWWSASALYLLVLTFCFTGFLLPMDQNALWGTAVRFGIVETAPVVGPVAADLLRGGPALNASTLTRFYALHVSILPALALVPLALLLRDLRPTLADGPALRRALLMALASIVGVYLAAFWLPASLEPRAAPGDADYAPRPEWYFLWLFQLGKYVESLAWLRSLVLPLLGLGLIAALPLLPPLSARTRALGALGLPFAWAALTGLALYEDRVLPPKPTHEQALASRAEAIYREECQTCHGLGGRGDGSQARSFGLEVPDFTRPGFWKDVTDDRMRASIRGGKGKDMPSFARKLAAEEIDGMVVLLGERFRSRVSAGPAR